MQFLPGPTPGEGLDDGNPSFLGTAETRGNPGERHSLLSREAFVQGSVKQGSSGMANVAMGAMMKALAAAKNTAAASPSAATSPFSAAAARSAAVAAAASLSNAGGASPSNAGGPSPGPSPGLDVRSSMVSPGGGPGGSMLSSGGGSDGSMMTPPSGGEREGTPGDFGVGDGGGPRRQPRVSFAAADYASSPSSLVVASVGKEKGVGVDASQQAVRMAGPARYCSPRHRMLFHSRNEV